MEHDVPRFEDAERHVMRIVRAVLDAASPAKAVERRWGSLDVPDNPTTIIAIGKGSVSMAQGAAPLLGPSLRRAIVVCPPEHADRCIAEWGHKAPLEVYPADHPFPTPKNLEATSSIERVAGDLGEGDLALVLITGGGSAQIASPLPGLNLDALRAVSSDLMRAGATIEELNSVRKHTETLKGGRLAALLSPAEVRVLVVSDVLGDPLDVVSSGPCAPDPTTYDDAIGVMQDHALAEKHEALMNILHRGAAGDLPETPKANDAIFERVRHDVLANNTIAIDAAVAAIRSMGFGVSQIHRGAQGDAAEAGRALASMLADPHMTGGPRAVVVGGETTVDVGDATGRGGRNQELALAASIELADRSGVVACSFGTDGIDGPTDAAGAWVTGGTVRRAESMGINARDALARHDSYGFFDRVGGHLCLGATGTNVNDVWFLLSYGDRA